MKLDMQNLMQQAQKMQEEMERIKNEAAQKIATADAGGGMVSVKINGNNDVLEIKINKEVVNPDDIEMLEDLVVAAVNKAIKAAGEMVNDEMSKVTGMLPNIPGMNLNF